MDSKILDDTLVLRKNDSITAFSARIISRTGSFESLKNEVCQIGSFSRNNSVKENELALTFNTGIRSLFLRLAITIIILIISLTCQALLMLTAEINYDSSIPPLKDRLHEVFSKGKLIPFMSVNIMISIIIIIICIRVIIFIPPFQALINIIRILMIMSVGYLIRGVFIAATIVPSATRQCIPGCRNSSNKLLVIIAGNFGFSDTCTDNIISGHTFSTILCLLCWLEFEKNLFLRIFAIVYCIVVCFFIVITKGHYTIDVLFGLSLAIVLYNIYNISLRIRISYACVSQHNSELYHNNMDFGFFWVIMGKIIGWFEVVDLRLKIIELSIENQSTFHKDVMGIISDDVLKSAFDIVSCKEMSKKLDFTNVRLFVNFVKYVFMYIFC